MQEGKKWMLESESHSVMSNSLQPQGLYSPWDSPGQNTGVDSLSLLQGIFPTQGLNPGLPHCRQILYHLSEEGIPVNLSLPHPSQVLAWGLGIMRYRNQQILRKRRAQRKSSSPFRSHQSSSWRSLDPLVGIPESTGIKAGPKGSSPAVPR